MFDSISAVYMPRSQKDLHEKVIKCIGKRYRFDRAFTLSNGHVFYEPNDINFNGKNVVNVLDLTDIKPIY